EAFIARLRPAITTPVLHSRRRAGANPTRLRIILLLARATTVRARALLPHHCIPASQQKPATPHHRDEGIARFQSLPRGPTLRRAPLCGERCSPRNDAARAMCAPIGSKPIRAAAPCGWAGGRAY